LQWLGNDSNVLAIRIAERFERPDRLRPCLQAWFEGIVSKRKDSTYRSGRSPDWLKMKNADAPAVKREEEEEWGKKNWR
jgi:ATP-dependent DNA ligase